MNRPALLAPPAFVDKWRHIELKERAACQEHFIDLCRLLDHPTPADARGESVRAWRRRGCWTLILQGCWLQGVIMAKTNSKRGKTSNPGPRLSRPLHLAVTIVALIITAFAFVVAPVSLKGLCLATAVLLVWQWVRAVRQS
jgi:hypothetical protein